MIHIEKKEDCCGCSACVSVCPKHCISMHEDEEGFLYPTVDITECYHCGLCEKVCPVINTNSARTPLHVYAAINLDEEVRKVSSSGGIFNVLAEKVIEDGGVVFGAVFDKRHEVRHEFTENKTVLPYFRGSKYVQSRIGTCYIDALRFLKLGRKVLFSGTPCQIAGLKNFIRKDYPNLITVDCLCHGVPSPLVWRKYLKEVFEKQQLSLETDVRISFRNKEDGWKQYKLSVNGVGDAKNLFLRGMTDRLFLRPICYHCPFREQKSQSDISLGDFWGIEHTDVRFADNKGTSMVLVNNDRAEKFFNLLDKKIFAVPKTYDYARQVCSMLYRSCSYNIKRESFFKDIQDLTVFQSLQNNLTKVSLKDKIKIKMKSSINKKIIFDYPGQTCNRLWSYVDTIAWALINHKRVVIWRWDTSIKYFDTLRDKSCVSFPFYNTFLINLLGEKNYNKLLNKTITNRYMVKLYRKPFFKKMGFMEGWKERSSYHYYPQVIDEVKAIFKPNDNIVNEVSNKIKAYKEKGYFIIGVHIRGGDYKTWEDGKYYYTPSQYAEFMKQVGLLYKDKKICFFISTNEKLDKTLFSEFPLVEMDNTTAIHDLYTLSICDRIIGPLSTFSRWASFYGNVPLLFLEKDMKIVSDSQFSVITDFYHFKNGTEIVNLSDKK